MPTKNMGDWIGTETRHHRIVFNQKTIVTKSAFQVKS